MRYLIRKGCSFGPRASRPLSGRAPEKAPAGPGLGVSPYLDVLGEPVLTIA
jgi:hypothetical protein